MQPDNYALRPQSLADLQRAELQRQAERINRIIDRRIAERERITTRLAITDGAPTP